MSLLKSLTDVIGVFLEIFIISGFFSMFAKARCSSKYMVLIYGFYLIIVSVLCIFAKSELITFLRVLVSIFAVSFLYKTNLFTRILLSVAIIVILLVSEVLTGLILKSMTDLPIEKIQQNIFYYLIGTVVSKLFLVVLIKASGYYIKPHEVLLSKIIIVVMLILPVSTFFIILSISDYAAAEQSDKNEITLFISVLGLIIANMALIYLFEWQLKEARKSSIREIERNQIKAQIDYYQKVLEEKEEYRKIVHNFKNELFAIQTLISKNKKEGIERIKELSNYIDREGEYHYTQNDSLNALIYSKINKIKGNNIAFNCKSTIMSQNKISDLDLCIIIGNLLDNAIEACEKLTEIEKKIDLELMQRDDYLTCNIENTYDSTIKIVEGTSKSNKVMHGIGLKSIEEIAEKYNGAVDIRKKGDLFCVTVILKNSIELPNMQHK